LSTKIEEKNGFGENRTYGITLTSGTMKMSNLIFSFSIENNISLSTKKIFEI
jgi:hypothetical protein